MGSCWSSFCDSCCCCCPACCRSGCGSSDNPATDSIDARGPNRENDGVHNGEHNHPDTIAEEDLPRGNAASDGTGVRGPNREVVDNGTGRPKVHNSERNPADNIDEADLATDNNEGSGDPEAMNRQRDTECSNRGNVPEGSSRQGHRQGVRTCHSPAVASNGDQERVQAPETAKDSTPDKRKGKHPEMKVEDTRGTEGPTIEGKEFEIEQTQPSHGSQEPDLNSELGIRLSSSGVGVDKEGGPQAPQTMVIDSVSKEGKMYGTTDSKGETKLVSHTSPGYETTELPEASNGTSGEKQATNTEPGIYTTDSTGNKAINEMNTRATKQKEPSHMYRMKSGPHSSSSRTDAGSQGKPRKNKLTDKKGGEGTRGEVEEGTKKAHGQTTRYQETPMLSETSQDVASRVGKVHVPGPDGSHLSSLGGDAARSGEPHIPEMKGAGTPKSKEIKPTKEVKGQAISEQNVESQLSHRSPPDDAKADLDGRQNSTSSITLDRQLSIVGSHAPPEGFYVYQDKPQVLPIAPAIKPQPSSPEANSRRSTAELDSRESRAWSLDEEPDYSRIAFGGMFEDPQ